MPKRKASKPLTIPQTRSSLPSSFYMGQRGDNSLESSPPIMGTPSPSSSIMSISCSSSYANSPSYMTGPSREIGTQTPTEKFTFDFPDARRNSQDLKDDDTGDVGRSLRRIGDDLDRRGSPRRNSLILFLQKSL